MSKIHHIFEKKSVYPYLLKRGLLDQYKKAKCYLLDGRLLSVRFKESSFKRNRVRSFASQNMSLVLRKNRFAPLRCYYFRINKQFRALAVFNKDGDLVVFEIDNHQ